MWIAHYAPGLIAKIFAPRVPLWLLAFAGEANDALFFLLQFTPLESFAVDPGLAQTGCFPYATHYPYSHSVLGMVLTGIALAGAYTALTGRKVSLGDQAAIVLTTLTHALLEWPAHRADVKVLPHDGTAIGAGMFDHPAVLFATELAIFFGGLWAYTTFAPLSARAGYKRNPNWMKAVIAVFLGEQVQFCLNAAPTANTKWVHAPLFLSTIIGSSWLLGKLEGSACP